MLSRDFFVALHPYPPLAYSKAMIKTPGVDLGVPARIGAVGMLYRIVSGETAALLKGEVFQLKLPDIIQDKVLLNLKGKEITVEGLPKSLEGRVVTFKVTGNGPAPLLELINPSIKIPENVAKGALANSTKPTPGNMTTPESKAAPTPPHPLTSKAVALRKATLTSTITSLPLGKTSFTAMVTHTAGKKAVLTPIPTTNAVATKESPKATSIKTAHAVANTTDPGKLISKEKAPLPLEIRLNTLAAPLKKGEQLLVEIKPGNSKRAALILKPAEQTTVQPSRSSQVGAATKSASTTFPTSFPTNKLITASVEQRLPNGKIVLQWQGQQLEAPAPANVKVGDTLLLRTTATPKTSGRISNPLPTLEVVDLVSKVPEKATTLFKQRIAMSEPLSRVLRSLTQPASPSAAGDKPLPANITSGLTTLTTLLENYTVSDSRPLDGHRLATMMRNSGHLYEAVLGKEIASGAKPESSITQNDLKAILLKLFEVTQSAEKTVSGTRIANASEQGTARIESQQSLNLLAFHQAEPLRMEFPLIMQGMISAVQMAISMERGNEHGVSEESDESSAQTFNILFALDLNHLGNVRVDARISSRSVHATIYSEKSDSRHLLQQHIARLTERLEVLGFKEIHLSASVSGELSETRRESFNRLELGLPISKGLLDVTG